MWRPSFTILRKVIIPSFKETVSLSRILYSTKSRSPRSTANITLISASVGILVGAGYGGYTHYKVNSSKRKAPTLTNEEFPLLTEPPQYKPQYRVINDADTSNLNLVLFQYRTCPFCCKVRAYLDARGISYEVVEVDAVLRQAIKWSEYKKVPIVLAKVEDGYQQLLDSTAIISILETYQRDRSLQLRDLVRYYPRNTYTGESGKTASEIANRYFVMSNEPVNDVEKRNSEIEERNWRKWADKVLVHTLSPNVYRTPSEALETFKWFEEVGGWKQTFPAWECAIMVYVGATAMWLISKRLKTRHHLKDDVRRSLFDAAKDWTSELKKKGTKFYGGDQPNLADISVYGILSSIEGCQAFKDLRSNNSDIGTWFDEVKRELQARQGKIEMANV